MKMYDGEVSIDAELVRRLVAETNPGFVALAKRTVEEALADIDV